MHVQGNDKILPTCKNFTQSLFLNDKINLDVFFNSTTFSLSSYHSSVETNRTEIYTPRVYALTSW